MQGRPSCPFITTAANRQSDSSFNDSLRARSPFSRSTLCFCRCCSRCFSVLEMAYRVWNKCLPCPLINLIEYNFQNVVTSRHGWLPNNTGANPISIVWSSYRKKNVRIDFSELKVYSTGTIGQWDNKSEFGTIFGSITSWWSPIFLLKIYPTFFPRVLNYFCVCLFMFHVFILMSCALYVSLH